MVALLEQSKLHEARQSDKQVCIYCMAHIHRYLGFLLHEFILYASLLSSHLLHFTFIKSSSINMKPYGSCNSWMCFLYQNFQLLLWWHWIQVFKVCHIFLFFYKLEIVRAAKMYVISTHDILLPTRFLCYNVGKTGIAGQTFLKYPLRLRLHDELGWS